MSHYGIIQDQQRKKANEKKVADSSADIELCSYCHGTGNEFYSMYRACPKCGGEGIVRVGVAE